MKLSALALSYGLPHRPTEPTRQCSVSTARYASAAHWLRRSVWWIRLGGRVIGRCAKRHRSAEFRAFLDQIEANVPADLDAHLVLDTAATHKTKLIHDWLLKRPRWHLHFTPTSASWLNLVKGWFALLTRRQLQRGAFETTVDLERVTHAYIDQTNSEPKPFV